MNHLWRAGRFAYLDAAEFGQAMAKDHECFKVLVAKLGIKP